MDTKVQQITEKIYHEGVEKGEQRAREIIDEAEKKASSIIESARREAEKIIADGRVKADEAQRNAEAAMRLAAGQVMSSLKQQILDVITARVVEKPVAEALSNPETITEFLRTILQNWKPESQGMSGIEVLLPEARREQLGAALEAALSRELAAGLSLRFTKAVTAGLQVKPQGASYKISLTDEDFQEYFKQYLRPKMRAFLFGE